MNAQAESVAPSSGVMATALLIILRVLIGSIQNNKIMSHLMLSAMCKTHGAYEYYLLLSYPRFC